MPETLIFARNPPGDRCSLCGSRAGPFTLEDRFTGKDFSLQRWPYCARCRSASQVSNPDADLVAQKYLVFLRWVMAGYRLERQRSGNVYRIVPKRKFDMSTRTGIGLIHAKKNNLKYRSGFDRSNEDTGRQGAPGCEHYDGGSLRDVSAKGREIRQEAKGKTEDLTRMERARLVLKTPDGP